MHKEPRAHFLSLQRELGVLVRKEIYFNNILLFLCLLLQGTSIKKGTSSTVFSHVWCCSVSETFLYTRSVRKVSDRIFLCEHLMDYNLARLHEPTLNLSAHA